MIVLLICMGIVVLDQVTKLLIRENYLLGSVHEIIPGFMNLTHLRNTGAAWGMLGSQNILLSLLSLVMLILLVVFRRSFLHATSCIKIHRIALGLLTGGIIGNLIDRVGRGAVTDFLDFYVANWHWPSFNVADSAICIGVGMYLIASYTDARRNKHEEEPA